MTEQQTFRIDNIKWWIETTSSQQRSPVPLCPDHDLRLAAVPPRVVLSRGAYGRTYVGRGPAADAVELKCAEGPHNLSLPRKYGEEQRYVLDRLDAKRFRSMKTLNLDDEAIPIAKTKAELPESKYFVTAQLMESKRGLQLVIYAGEKGSSDGKAQLFVEPEVRRVSFDQRDLHPADVFTKVEVTFKDGTSQTIQR